MNKIDKGWYKSLKFLSKLTIEETMELKKKSPKMFKKFVPEEMENTLEKFGYITFMCDVVQIVTQSGLQQLRDLEDIKRKDLTLISAVVAVFISLVALAKSFGLI